MSVGECCREPMVTGPAAVERVASVTMSSPAPWRSSGPDVCPVIGDPSLSMYNVEGCAGWAAQSLIQGDRPNRRYHMSDWMGTRSTVYVAVTESRTRR